MRSMTFHGIKLVICSSPLLDLDMLRSLAILRLKLCKLNAHKAGCYCIGIPLDRYFAVGSADSLVSLWDVKEWPVRTVSFNHTGEYIAYGSEDPFIDIANVQTGRSVHQIPCKAAMNSVEWNPKYNLLAYAGDDKNKYEADEGVF